MLCSSTFESLLELSTRNVLYPTLPFLLESSFILQTAVITHCKQKPTLQDHQKSSSSA